MHQNYPQSKIGLVPYCFLFSSIVSIFYRNDFRNSEAVKPYSRVKALLK